MPAEPSRRIGHARRIGPAAFALAGLAMLAYLPALFGGFIWDDDHFLTRNALIRASDGLYRFWFTTQPQDYWPLTSSTLWLEWRLWGMNPLGYHLTNLVLHLGAVFLLWRILVRLRIPGAYIAAFFFAVHPVNAESVVWITQRKNLLAMVFFLLSVLWFLESEESTGKKARWYWLSWLAFLLAMLSKASVAPLPLVLLGIVGWKHRPGRRDWIRLVPFVAVGTGLALVNVWFQSHTYIRFRPAGVLQRILGAAAAIWFYWGKALLPLKLTFIYPQWRVHPNDWRWWIPLLGILGVTVVLMRTARLRPSLAAWLFFGIMLLPAAGLTDVSFMAYSLVADHYQHLAIIGVAAIAGFSWARWQEYLGGWIPKAVAAGVILSLAALTWRQSQIYGDAETLYRTTIERNPAAWMARTNLGTMLADAGRAPEAVDQFSSALTEATQDAEASLLTPPARAYYLSVIHYDLGKSLRDAGRNQEAIGQFQTALQLSPRYPDANNSLGISLAREGRSAEAIARFTEALRIDPDNLEARRNLEIMQRNSANP
jgi:tetratricopeptide (TPR) repeat protein